MADETLKQCLEDLRTEIERLEAGDEAARARLNRLVTDIERRLAAPDDAEHDATLVQNLKQSIEQFEIEHPRATGILNQIIITLSNLGI